MIDKFEWNIKDRFDLKFLENIGDNLEILFELVLKRNYSKRFYVLFSFLLLWLLFVLFRGHT